MERFRACLSGYGGTIFPSKAHRIMSRYRPIAPKPPLPSISDVERSASSALSFDSLCVRNVPDASTSTLTPKQKSKRVRKRPSKEFEGQMQQPAKRLASDALTSPASEMSVPLSGMSCSFAADSAAPLLIQEDAGFMERAAASAPPSVLPVEKTRQNNSYGYGGCFTELIRGIAGLPTANHVHYLLQQQQQQHQLSNVLSQPPPIGHPPKLQQDVVASHRQEKNEGKDYTKDEVCSDAFWSCFSDGNLENAHASPTSEEAQQSGLDEEGIDADSDQRKGIITLSLLPVAPTTADSSMLSSGVCDSPHTSTRNGMSLARLEEVYGRSSEPIILIDDACSKILWANQAYIKACKDNSNMLAPFIDPLGTPTQLGRYHLLLENQQECTSVSLWGFLKKFVVDMANRDLKTLFPVQATALLNKATSESKFGSPALPWQLRLGMSNAASSHTLNFQRVITPQPIRLVGSVVSVESLAEIQMGHIKTCTLELLQEQLEEGNLPGLITDASNVVRYVNSSYKAMVGQPECPWLASTMKGGGGTAPTITGEVSLSCKVEVPTSAVSFSGRANVQWTRNTGERSCMTLPVDVTSFMDGYWKRMLVWRFDRKASLSLSCGAERLA